MIAITMKPPLNQSTVQSQSCKDIISMQTSSVNSDSAPQFRDASQSFSKARSHSCAAETSRLRRSLVRYAATEGTDLGPTG